MSSKTQYFCDICCKEKYAQEIATFYDLRRYSAKLDVCLHCQTSLIRAALNHPDIVTPRSLCKMCKGKGYVRAPGVVDFPYYGIEPCKCGNIST